MRCEEYGTVCCVCSDGNYVGGREEQCAHPEVQL